MKRSIAVALSLGTGALLLAFQNCSNQTGFSSSGELVSKAVDVATDNTDVIPVVGTDDDRDEIHDQDVGNENHHHPGAKEPCNNSAHTVADSSTALSFVCVLRGNGKSERIGLRSGSLDGQVGTPQDVCMSENACLSILAAKFAVQSAERRGFCSNLSAHVVSMTDLEIEAALAHAELNRLMAAQH